VRVDLTVNARDIWDRLWSDITSTVEPTLVAALVPLAVVVFALAVPAVWHAVRHIVTIVHEAGHAVVAVLTGRRLSGIRLHSDTSGLTRSVGQHKRLPLALVALAGYPAPAILGVGAAALLGSGRPLAVLWGTVALLLAVLLQIRNVYGYLVVELAAGGLGWLAWSAPDVWRVGAAYAIAWLLLLGAVRAVVELSASRRRGQGSGSDADNLGALTHIRGGAWVALFWLVAVACAAAGAWLVLRQWLPISLG